MKAIIFSILILLNISGHAWAETRNAEEYFFDQKLGDFKSELDAAKKDGKTGVLLMYELDDCPFCDRMKKTVLNQTEVQDFYHKHFSIFFIDLKGDVAMTDFKGKQTTEKAFGVEQRIYGTPVFDFFDLNGDRVVRFPGATRDVGEFMLLGKYVVEGAYKDMPFAKFKRQVQDKK
jgi:thioredoxin-related protein